MALQLFSPKRQHELMLEYTNESLFRLIHETIDEQIQKKFALITIVEGWTDAKTLIKKIFESKYPESMVAFQLNDLLEGYSFWMTSKRDSSVSASCSGSKLSESEIIDECSAVFMGAWSILLTIQAFSPNKHVDCVISSFSTNIKQIYCHESVIKKYEDIKAKIGNAIKAKEIIIDYDYLNNHSLIEHEDSHVRSFNYPQTMVVECFKQLFHNHNFGNNCTQTVQAELISFFTGYNQSKVNGLLSKSTGIPRKHARAVEHINEILNKMDINVFLETKN